MHNDILALMKVITILYLDNLLSEKSQHVIDEVRIVMTGIKLQGRGSTLLGSEGSAVEALYKTAEWMLSHYDNDTLTFSRANILQRLKVNLYGDNEYIKIAEEFIPEEIDATEAKRRIDGILAELRYEKRQNHLRGLIAKANSKINFGSDTGVDTAAFIRDLMMELEGMGTAKSGHAPGFVGKIDFNEPEEIAEILTKTAESTSAEGVIKTGLQGLDRACGVGGILRGALVNFGALTHNYKSGILIDLSLFIPMFNDPWMWDEKKKPMILRISFENTLDQDIGIMYSKLYEMEHQKRCILSEINTGDAAKALSDHYGQRGYEFHLESYDPNNFSVFDLFDVINNYIDNGYEIHAISCDYLSMIADNTIGDRKDSKIQKTYEMVRNFCYPKGITFLTAHQLSTEAQNLARENSGTFTKKVCQGGWYMDCRSLHTKLDLEFVMHIHKHIDGKKYLMFSEGKNRACSHVPETHRHFVYPFQEFGGIIPDLEKDDLSLPKLPDVVDTGAMAAWGDD